MAKYRKKPVVIEAEVYRPGLEDGFERCFTYKEAYLYQKTQPFMGFDLAEEWVKAGAKIHGQIPASSLGGGTPHVLVPFIETLEGRHYITPGDYIITGIKGERYPCKPDIFALTYEPAEGGQRC